MPPSGRNTAGHRVPSAEVLAGNAGARRLTDAASGRLHVLAGTRRTRTRLHRRAVRPSTLALLERLRQTAGVVMSAAFEVAAWSHRAAALGYDVEEEAYSGVT